MYLGLGPTEGLQMCALTKDCTHFSFNAGAHVGAQTHCDQVSLQKVKHEHTIFEPVFFTVKAISFSEHRGLLKFDIPADKRN